MNKIFICLLIVAGVLTGWTRYGNPQPYFEEYEKETTDGSIQRKVLIVVVDGLVGLELKKDVPANLTAMMAKGKYSFEALADENTSDPASWATLATGVNATRHRIITESYIPAPDPLNPHRETPSAASFLYMIKQQNKRMLTTVVTQSRDLSHILLLDAKETLVEENDQAVKTAAVEKLKDANLDL
ncbi:MAG TPA: alkaline phosphatase family protein, partial [Sphingobacterium sp.]|nr:alkaline phosphatase family protein [Sphingobacterium sp.]